MPHSYRPDAPPRSYIFSRFVCFQRCDRHLCVFAAECHSPLPTASAQRFPRTLYLSLSAMCQVAAGHSPFKTLVLVCQLSSRLTNMHTCSPAILGGAFPVCTRAHALFWSMPSASVFVPDAAGSTLDGVSVRYVVQILFVGLWMQQVVHLAGTLLRMFPACCTPIVHVTLEALLFRILFPLSTSHLGSMLLVRHQRFFPRFVSGFSGGICIPHAGPDV